MRRAVSTVVMRLKWLGMALCIALSLIREADSSGDVNGPLGLACAHWLLGEGTPAHCACACASSLQTGREHVAALCHAGKTTPGAAQRSRFASLTPAHHGASTSTTACRTPARPHARTPSELPLDSSPPPPAAPSLIVVDNPNHGRRGHGRCAAGQDQDVQGRRQWRGREEAL